MQCQTLKKVVLKTNLSMMLNLTDTQMMHVPQILNLIISMVCFVKSQFSYDLFFFLNPNLPNIGEQLEKYIGTDFLTCCCLNGISFHMLWTTCSRSTSISFYSPQTLPAVTQRQLKQKEYVIEWLRCQTCGHKNVVLILGSGDIAPPHSVC